MHFTFTPIAEAEARAVLAWHYPHLPHASEVDASLVARGLDALLYPPHNYYAARDQTGGLAGFCCFGEDAQVPGGDYTLNALDIGLGLHPALLGRRLGDPFLTQILALGRLHFVPNLFRATVATYNERSLRLFARSGFATTQTFTAPNDVCFHLLVRLAADPQLHPHAAPL